MKGVLSFTDEELVSSDFIHNVQLGPKIGRMTYSNAPGGNVVYHYFSRIFTFVSFWDCYIYILFIRLVLRDISSVMQLCTCILSTYFSLRKRWNYPGGWDISLRYFEGGKIM